MLKIKENIPLVSVVMNCFNGERYIKESINSVMKQTYQNWELIIFDNFSDDGSKKIIDEYTKDKRIKYFKSKSHLKLYDARNQAVNLSSGKFICFLDTDDIWIKDKIEKQIKYINENKIFDLIYSNYFIKQNNSQKLKIKFKEKLPEGSITTNLLKDYKVGILTILIKREVFKFLNFNKNYEIIGDFDFVISLSKKKKIGSIQEPLAIYRDHKDNTSKKKIDLYIKEVSSWIKDNEVNLRIFSNLFNLKFYLFKLKIKKFLKYNH